MKVIVHTPLSYDREYLNDYNEETIPSVGDQFEELYIVKEKKIKGNICELTLGRNENWYKEYEELYMEKEK